MKHASILVMIFGILLSSCAENSLTERDSVEDYIQLLRSNQYHSDGLPLLTHQDIPLLLEYRNETQIITNYPRNPISSYHQPECVLGMYVLWTIESIRAVSIDSKFLIMGFPSQNPVLGLRDADALEFVSDNTSHSVAAEAYYDWWTNHKDQDFDTFKNVDPLGTTGYRWH